MSAKHLSSDISSYGGDSAIVATRVEIDRVMAELTGISSWLRDQIELEDFFTETIPRVRLALELPPILERLEHIRNACADAADAYFGKEAEISRELRENIELPIKNIAAGFAGLGATMGLFVETPVSAKLVSVENYVEPAATIAELSRRLNQVAQVQPGWVRIEKFNEPASPVKAATMQVSPSAARYVVYIPGTQEWGAAPGTNPLDLTSNLSAISKTGFAGSERAVALAMAKAGITHDSKVLLVGHSQGGLVAANISTRFAGSRVLTFGAPLSQVGAELTADTLAVEHVGDLVPRLDDKPNPIKANLVTVRQDISENGLLKQHSMDGYGKTATDIDAATDPGNPGFDRVKKEIAEFSGLTQGQALYFELERTR